MNDLVKLEIIRIALLSIGVFSVFFAGCFIEDGYPFSILLFMCGVLVLCVHVELKEGAGENEQE